MNKLIIIVLLSIISVSIAKEHVLKGVNDERKLTFIKKDYGAAVFARKSGVGAAIFSFDVQGFPRFRSKVMTKSNEAKEFFSFRVGLRKILEFNDQGEAGFGLEDKDSIVQVESLIGKKTRWTKYEYKTHNVTYQGEEIKVHTVQTSTDLKNGGSLVLKCHFSPKKLRQSANSSTIRPNALKFDVHINGFNYTQENTSLAVIFVTNFKTKSRYGNVDNTPDAEDTGSLTVGGDDEDTAEGAFEWKRHMRKKKTLEDENGEEIEVIVRSLKKDDVKEEANADALDDGKRSTESKRWVSFTIEGQPKDIFWDPSISAGSSGALSASMAFIAVLAVLKMFF